MIINIEQKTFGGPARIGDLIGIANVVEHIRKINNDTSIKFYMKPGTINKEKYVGDFYSLLIGITDYFSAFEGSESLPWRNVNVWDFRDISGDLVKIPNNLKPEFKIVVFPLFDAPYNQWRNWPEHVFEQILKKCENDYPSIFEKIICINPNINLDRFDTSKWKISTNFLDNINHIMESNCFIGGDTGTTHFAFALDRGPHELLYYGSSRALVHTLPFYLLQGKGRISNYWLDFERTKWN